LYVSNESLFKIVESEASDIGWGGILKQVKDDQEQIIQFASGVWNLTERNYSTIEKEVRGTWNCIDMFDIHIVNKKFLFRTDASTMTMKKVLSKDIKNRENQSLPNGRSYSLTLTLK